MPDAALLTIATHAVVAASRVCEAVRRDLADADALTKGDKSPVTVADFASQAVVASFLAESGLPLVAEEDAAELRNADESLRDRTLKAVRQVRDGASFDQIADWIDAGGTEPNGLDRYWILDPIDGTKGFLRGGQYAVALGLVENGQVTLGVLGCPQWDAGRLFGAMRGQDAWTAPVEAPEQRQPISVGGREPHEMKLVESVESGHSDHSASADVAKALGITAEPERMDSQAKYAAVACGAADLYLRLPTRPSYVEKVWDHAAGLVVIEAAGGRVTDIDGKPLDFTQGRGLSNNRGVIASSNVGDLHERAVEAVKGAGLGAE